MTVAHKFLSLTLLLAGISPLAARAQDDWIHIDQTKGAERIRLAASDFKRRDADAATTAYQKIFDATLANDLAQAGIFDMVSKSMLPQTSPGIPAEVSLAQFSGPPANASMLAFGNLVSQGGRLVVAGYLDDVKNAQYPQIFAKQYNERASEDAARQIAHRFADEIIARLGGGINGIAETKIYYSKIEGGNKEIWAMDYDGANQHAITHLGTTSIAPHVSPDNSRVAFESLGRNGFQIRMYSLLLNRMVNFPAVGNLNVSPSWSPNGRQIVFSSARTGDPEIWVADADGNLAHKLTSFPGPDVSPVFNPKTGAQIAWISGRTRLPQLYTMDADGSGIQRLTDGGYATSPSWSPNGQFLAFAWNRKYGPGAPGGQDIYVMEISTKRWIQLTHDIGRCDFPSWSPDGRHIVFANEPDGRADHVHVMTMLADGTQKRSLTGSGADMPNWSWK